MAGIGSSSPKFSQGSMILLPILGMISAVGVIGLLIWLYGNTGKQRNRLINVANSLGVQVTDIRGLPKFGCLFVGTILFWILLGIFIISFVVAYGPAVRQYRTVRIYNEVVSAFNQRQNHIR